MKRKKTKKGRKKSDVGAIASDIEVNEREVERKLQKRKQEFSKKLNKVTSEVDDMLESNREVQKLRKQIKEKPLVYAALAFALGMALGGMCRRKD